MSEFSLPKPTPTSSEKRNNSPINSTEEGYIISLPDLHPFPSNLHTLTCNCNQIKDLLPAPHTQS